MHVDEMRQEVSDDVINTMLNGMNATPTPGQTGQILS